MAGRSRISLSTEARLDLRHIYDYYESQRSGLGRRFLRNLVEILDAIVMRPTSFPAVHETARRAIVKDFQYGVFFRELLTHVEVFAIVDLRRHPRHWRRRALADLLAS